MLKSAPVVLHKWFEDGEGWSYPSTVDKQLLQIIHAINRPLMTAGATDQKSGIIFDSGLNATIIYQSEPDHNCLDVMAKNRGPFFFRAVIIEGTQPQDISDKLFKKIVEALSKIDCLAEGVTESFYLDLEALQKAKDFAAVDVKLMDLLTGIPTDALLITMAGSDFANGGGLRKMFELVTELRNGGYDVKNAIAIPESASGEITVSGNSEQMAALRAAIEAKNTTESSRL